MHLSDLRFPFNQALQKELSQSGQSVAFKKAIISLKDKLFDTTIFQELDPKLPPPDFKTLTYERSFRELSKYICSYTLKSEEEANPKEFSRTLKQFDKTTEVRYQLQELTKRGSVAQRKYLRINKKNNQLREAKKLQLEEMDKLFLENEEHFQKALLSDNNEELKLHRRVIHKYHKMYVSTEKAYDDKLDKLSKKIHKANNLFLRLEYERLLIIQDNFSDMKIGKSNSDISFEERCNILFLSSAPMIVLRCAKIFIEYSKLDILE